MSDYLNAARVIQTGFMADTVRIDHPTGTRLDRASGIEVEEWETVYEGPARLPRADASIRVVVTGQTITPASPVVLVPWDVVTVRPDDRITVTESLTPANVGRVLWVTDMSPRTHQSAVHLTCREVR